MNVSTDSVQISRPTDHVLVITLNRPDRLNAMNADLVVALHDAFNHAAADRDCRVVILTGAGRGFCAGLDLKGYDENESSAARGIPKGMAVQKAISSLPVRMRSLPQPIIAAVNGAASGGGLALVLASDIRLSSASARYNVAFVRIGISGCDVGTSWLLPRIVGAARAQELMLTGRLIDADEALRIGLVVDVVPDDILLAVALAKADEVLGNSPLGVSFTKEAMWAALEIPGMQTAIELENRQQVLLGGSQDRIEAATAFLQNRRPEFKGI
jgi:enoyl-CoA hydratase/carnithine racemase